MRRLRGEGPRYHFLRGAHDVEGDGTGRAFGARYFSRFSRLLCFLSGGERVTYRRRRRHNTTHWDTRGHMRATPDAALPVRPFLTPLALCVALPTMLLIELIHALRPSRGEVCLYNVVGYRLPVGLVIW